MSVDVSAVSLALGLDVISPSPSYGGVTEANFSVGAKGEIHTVPEELSESSSIGVPDDSDGDGEGEVESKPSGSLPSLASLEESLPIKRGLSNHFMGKSKSFGNLSEVMTVKEMAKRENPLNKRRRTMIAYKWSKNRSSLFGCRGNPTSMPLLSLNEDEDEDEEVCNRNQEDEDEDEDEDERRQHLKSSKSCFSLTDLRK